MNRHEYDRRWFRPVVTEDIKLLGFEWYVGSPIAGVAILLQRQRVSVRTFVLLANLLKVPLEDLFITEHNSYPGTCDGPEVHLDMRDCKDVDAILLTKEETEAAEKAKTNLTDVQRRVRLIKEAKTLGLIFEEDAGKHLHQSNARAAYDRAAKESEEP